MPTSHRKSELALVVGFLAVIAAVPITQTCLELARGERVQFTDVFRQRPTAKNLRQFEHTLEEKSWFQQKLRPETQQLLFATLHDTGSKGVLGRDRWLFYRPDVRYLIESPLPRGRGKGEGESVGMKESPSSPSPQPSPAGRRGDAPRLSHCESVERAIVRFRDQLKERGIALVVVPIPGKPSVYPDKLTRRAADKEVRSPTLELLDHLRRHDVETVDLFAAFDETRRSGASDTSDLYLAQDTHWTPRGAQLAAQVVANQLRELKLAPEPAIEFQVRPASVTRWGDILDMMQIPGLRAAFPAERVDCQQVLDAAGGLLVPSPADRPGTYRFPGQGTSVLVLGDSFCRIYQFPEPQSLGEAPASSEGELSSTRPVGQEDSLPQESPGHLSHGASGTPGFQAATDWDNPRSDASDELRHALTAATTPREKSGTKRLLPGSAGFISHLALALKAPVDAIVSDGGASTDVRRKLSTNPEILEGKKVVIWEFVERDIALGAQGWEDVPLPLKLD